MAFLDRVRQAFGGGGTAMSVQRPRAMSEFFRGNVSPFLASWKPALRDRHDDIAVSYREAAARAVDMIQNSGFIAGAVEQSTAFINGEMLHLNAAPDLAILGWNPADAQQWARDVEAKFLAWATSPIDCDASGKMTLGQMGQVQYASYLAYGEHLALAPIIGRREGTVPTKIMVLPPHRLANKNDSFQGIVNGVEIDRYGLPKAYWFEDKRLDRAILNREIKVRAYDRDGRRQVIHVIAPGPAVTRGISPLAPVLKVCRQLDQYWDATITAALIQTIFAAVVKTNATGAEAFEGLMSEGDQERSGALDLDRLATAKADWYDAAKIDLFTHGKVAHLFPNDELQFLKAEHPGQQFDATMKWLIFEISRACGLTYEDTSGDYRSATYSSVRAASSANWGIVTMRRSNMAAPFYQQAYEAWLEDAIGIGMIRVPGGLPAFYANKPAICSAYWSGPAKPQADDFKAANAHKVLYELGVTTLQQICAEYGRDWESVLEQRARERDYAMKLGLPDPEEDRATMLGKQPEGDGDGETGDRTDNNPRGG
jgi:lambda family phage portal protein